MNDIVLVGRNPIYLVRVYGFGSCTRIRVTFKGRLINQTNQNKFDSHSIQLLPVTAINY